jgi:hypothetical protein
VYSDLPCTISHRHYFFSAVETKKADSRLLSSFEPNYDFSVETRLDEN